MLLLRFLGFLHFWAQLLADCQIDAQNTYLHHRPCTFVCVNRPVGEWKRVLLLAFETPVLQAMRIPNCSSSHGIDLGLPMFMGTVVGAFPLQQVAMVFLELVSILSHSSCVVVHGAPFTSRGRQSSKFRPSDYPNTTYSAFLGQKRKLHPLQQPTVFLLQNMFAIVWTWT